MKWNISRSLSFTYRSCTKTYFFFKYFSQQRIRKYCSFFIRKNFDELIVVNCLIIA